jgi:tetratricopeptide (TPR) repeat protein
LIDVATKVIGWVEREGKEHESFGVGMSVYPVSYAFLGCGAGYLGNFEKGEVFFEKALDFASGIDDKMCLGLIEMLYSFVYSFKGDGQNTIIHAERAIQYCEEAEYLHVLGNCWLWFGLGHFFAGNAGAAKKYVEKGLTIQNQVGNTNLLSCYFLSLAMIHFTAGERKDAEQCAREALKLSEANFEQQFEAYSRIWLGRISGKTAEIVEAIDLCEALNLKPFSAQGYLFLGESCLNANRNTEARENLKKAEEMLREMGMDYWLAETTELLARL